MKKNEISNSGYEVRSKVRLQIEPILQWRARKELTQAQAAKIAGVSLPTYQNAEYGRMLQLVSASRVAKAIKVPLEKLRERHG